MRNRAPEGIVHRISDLLGERIAEELRMKYSRETSSSRAFVNYIMRTICGYTYKKICEYIGNMLMSGISRLTNEGFKLIKENTRYRNAFNSLIQVG